MAVAGLPFAPAGETTLHRSLRTWGRGHLRTTRLIASTTMAIILPTTAVGRHVPNRLKIAAPARFRRTVSAVTSLPEAMFISAQADKYLKQGQLADGLHRPRQWNDLVSYDPRLPETMRLFVQRVPQMMQDDCRDRSRDRVIFLAEVDATVEALTRQFTPELEAA
jgi:hypothetical protein